MSRRCRRHKERRRYSVQILDNYMLCFNNPPSSPFLRVTFRQKPNLKWQTLSLQNTEDPKK